MVLRACELFCYQIMIAAFTQIPLAFQYLIVPAHGQFNDITIATVAKRFKV